MTALAHLNEKFDQKFKNFGYTSTTRNSMNTSSNYYSNYDSNSIYYNSGCSSACSSPGSYGSYNSSSQNNGYVAIHCNNISLDFCKQHCG